MRLCHIGKIASWKAVNSFLEVSASVRGIAGALGITAEPVKRVYGTTGNRILTQENGHFVVGVRLVIQISHPSNPPFSVVGILAAGVVLQDAFVVVRRFRAIEEHPIIISGGHER